MTDPHCVEATIVALDGEFDLAQRVRVTDAFETIAPNAFVVVDLERTRYIDSTVLSCLIRLRAALVERGGALVLAAPRPTIRRLLEVAGLTGHFDIRNGLAEVHELHHMDDTNVRRFDVVADVVDE